LYISTSRAILPCLHRGEHLRPAHAQTRGRNRRHRPQCRQRIFIATNGASEGGCNNPQRQGLSAACWTGIGEQYVRGIPTIASDYSPVWDANLYEWTQDAIDKGYRGLLTRSSAF